LRRSDGIPTTRPATAAAAAPASRLGIITIESPSGVPSVVPAAPAICAPW
jgi:hypothetical protein